MAKKKVPLPKKLVGVEWEDTFYDDDVHTEEQLATENTTCTIFTVGFFAGEDEKVYKVAMDWSPHGSHYRHVCRIRKENIQQIHHIAGGSD